MFLSSKQRFLHHLSLQNAHAIALLCAGNYAAACHVFTTAITLMEQAYAEPQDDDYEEEEDSSSVDQDEELEEEEGENGSSSRISTIPSTAATTVGPSSTTANHHPATLHTEPSLWKGQNLHETWNQEPQEPTNLFDLFCTVPFSLSSSSSSCFLYHRALTIPLALQPAELDCDYHLLSCILSYNCGLSWHLHALSSSLSARHTKQEDEASLEQALLQYELALGLVSVLQAPDDDEEEHQHMQVDDDPNPLSDCPKSSPHLQQAPQKIWCRHHRTSLSHVLELVLLNNCSHIHSTCLERRHAHICLARMGRLLRVLLPDATHKKASHHSSFSFGSLATHTAATTTNRICLPATTAALSASSPPSPVSSSSFRSSPSPNDDDDHEESSSSYYSSNASLVDPNELSWFSWNLVYNATQYLRPAPMV